MDSFLLIGRRERPSLGQLVFSFFGGVFTLTLWGRRQMRLLRRPSAEEVPLLGYQAPRTGRGVWDSGLRIGFSSWTQHKQVTVRSLSNSLGAKGEDLT